MENETVAVPIQIALDSSLLFGLWGTRSGYYVAIAAILLTAWLLTPKSQSHKLGVPFYKAPKKKWIFDAETLIKDSYQRFKDQVYQIKGTEGVQVLVPPKYVAELKGLPEDVLSVTAAVADALQSKYTKFNPGHNGDLLSLVVRTRLTQNLAQLIPRLKGELEYIVGTEFPACDDWTPVKWQPFGLRAIARLSGLAFVGPSINRQEQWMDATINFAIHVFTAIVKLQFIPEWARPIGQYFVTDLQKIRQDIEVAKEMLKPLLEERLRDMELSTSYEAPNDLMQWLIEALPEGEKADVQIQAELQLILSAASIHSVNNFVFECMCDLAAHPDVQAELGEEAHQILETESGWLRKDNMARLKKMDSFMKEVQRLRGNITSFIRKVMKPISLSDGTQLPAGTKVIAPQAGMSFDERFFTDPEEFDALRFYRMRHESSEANNRWQFTTLSDNNMNFGAGKHACPGRFFASNEAKLILGYFLINYDIRLKKGETRPMPMAMVMSKFPSPDVELEFRRRSLVE